MSACTRHNRALAIALLWLWGATIHAGQPDSATQADSTAVIRGVDAAVQARYDHVLAFTDIEHYRVFRGGDQSHPVAEMTVKDSYRKGEGKTYTILSQSGSELVARVGLKPLLENEKIINQPANVAGSWFTSANYEMKPGAIESLSGRACVVVAVAAKRKAPNMINGRIWVDVRDYSLAQIEGVAAKNPSIFSGATHMMRQYAEIDGFPMATHAHAESNSALFGRTVVTIDYSDYELTLKQP
jgi:hypothetical protein